MKCLILGGGYGVRLYPLTKNMPKPLLPIVGRPVLEWTMQQLLKIKAVDEIFIVVNQHFYEHYQQWLTNYQSTLSFVESKKRITLCNDETTSNDNRLGAIGDIQFVIERNHINDDLLIIAGDNLFMFDLNEFFKFYKTHGASVALKNMIGLDKKLISQYSVVTIDEVKKLITNFEEKPPMPQSVLIAICLYLFSPKELGLFKEYLAQGLNPDAPGYYIQWLYKRNPIYGCVLKGNWFDIGDIDSYNKANDYYIKSHKKQAMYSSTKIL